MRCPCRGCTDRTVTCHCEGQCERWGEWRAYHEARKKWLKDQLPVTSEESKKRANKNIVQKARGWKRVGRVSDE